MTVRHRVADWDWKLPDKPKETCDICGCSSEDRSMVWDHCHEDGDRIRGRICKPCNNKLGWFERFGEVIHAYLENPPRSGSYRKTKQQELRAVRQLNSEAFRAYRRAYEGERRKIRKARSGGE